jgi:hypothetical protein
VFRTEGVYGRRDSVLRYQLGKLVKADSVNGGERERQVAESANTGERPQADTDTPCRCHDVDVRVDSTFHSAVDSLLSQTYEPCEETEGAQAGNDNRTRNDL